MKTLLKNRELSAFFAIVALFVVLVALNPAYFSLQTLAMIFASSQILCLLALGATLVMLTRNIDVSVGSTVGLCAIAVGVALNNGYGLATAIAFALAIGALAGAFNGLLVVGLRIPAIVATLGTLGLYRGVMLLWTGGKWIEGLPDSLKSLSEPAFIGVSPLGWLVLARGLLVVMVVCLLILVFYGSDVVYRFDSWWDAKHDPLGTFQSSGSLNGSETDLPPTTLLDIKKELPGGSILHFYGVGTADAPGDRKETIVYLYAVCYHRMPFLHAAYLPDLTFSCHGHTTSAEWRPNIGFFDVVYRLYPVYVPQDARKITLHYDHYGTRFALEIPLPQEEVRTP